MKVAIQIVTWNSLKFLPDCLKAIKAQTYQNFSILIIDNASQDGTREYLQKNFPEINILRNNRNLGFATAHNRGLRLNQGDDYILVINPDIILEKDWLEKILPIIEEDREIGAIGGKLLKIYTSDFELEEKVKTKIIDSTGLKIFKSRRVIDRGEGELDCGQYNKKEEVFGLSGACVLYRRQALEDIKIIINKKKSNTNPQISKDEYLCEKFIIDGKVKRECGEYFDEDFFSYKEDVDLSWRLRLRGWKIFYYPQAIAYHYRQVYSQGKKIKEIIKRRKEKSPLVNYLSYRNHLYCLIKNDFFINFLKDLPLIIFYELKKLFYLFFFEQKTLKGWWEILKNLPKIIKKRKYIMKNKKISSQEIRKWFQ
ncbi:MAG: glycosyltransferase family 2 protein [Patescibacteria group bacterium]|nr:glycosyltransferase family 2 protein [Patescibacteria group bacterium]